MRKFFNKNNKGFTLVELIIVIAIIAIITVVLAPQYLRYVQESKQKMDENAIGEIAHAAEVAAVDTDLAGELGDKDIIITVTYDEGTEKTTVTVKDEAGANHVPFETNLKATIADGSYNLKSDSYRESGATIELDVNTGHATWTAGIEEDDQQGGDDNQQGGDDNQQGGDDNQQGGDETKCLCGCLETTCEDNGHKYYRKNFSIVGNSWTVWEYCPNCQKVHKAAFNLDQKPHGNQYSGISDLPHNSGIDFSESNRW